MIPSLYHFNTVMNWLITMKWAFEDRYGKESGVKIDTPMMIENIELGVRKIQKRS